MHVQVRPVTGAAEMENVTTHKYPEPRSVAAIKERILKIRLDLASLKDGAAAAAQGYVLSAEYSIKGAIKFLTYTKQKTSVQVGKKLVPSEVLRSTRVIEDQDAYNEAQKIVSEAIKLTEKFTAPYINGLKFAEPEDFTKIDKALAPLREKAQDLNDAAVLKHSQMRVKIEIYKFLVDTSDRRNSLRLAQFIHERLLGLRAMYTDKRFNAFRIQMDNVTNLQKVVTGKQRDLIELAIASTEAQRDRMIFNYGGKKGTADLVTLYGDKDAPFDYEAIDTAIAVFAPSLKIS
jgi:hypothetical protein